MQDIFELMEFLNNKKKEEFIIININSYNNIKSNYKKLQIKNDQAKRIIKKLWKYHKLCYDGFYEICIKLKVENEKLKKALKGIE